ncbi:MAG: PKD domain-containing protein [Actinomycetota bacterium]|nr:PKD domain-containing protein [Actinomycetota bacterium]
MKNSNLYERLWATVLIVVGVVLLGVVFFSAFGIVKDPGEFYDKWVPADGVEGPEAAFDWASSDLVVEFVDTSSAGDANLERWAWDFGDGSESTDPNPSHRFDEDGEFGITLDVVDGNGLASRAEATVGVETGAENSGQGALGLNDLADSVIDAVERGAKGGGVVLLVIGLFVVLTMVGGRLLRQGVRVLRPIPDRISVKLRPKNLELAMTGSEAETPDTTEIATPPPPPAPEAAVEVDKEDQ